MRLADQWRRILAALPDQLGQVRVAVRLRTPERRPRAAALLGPAAPTGLGDELTFFVGEGGVSPETVTRLLGKLDREFILGTVRVVHAVESATPPAEEKAAEPSERLATAWADAVATLPADWSDLYCELELYSSDHLDVAALLLAPLNPARDLSQPASLRFRVAHSFGYGASPEMTARCLARLDEAKISGQVRILRALSDTHNVDTQGPVWRVGGKAV